MVWNHIGGVGPRDPLAARADINLPLQFPGRQTVQYRGRRWTRVAVNDLDIEEPLPIGGVTSDDASEGLDQKVIPWGASPGVEKRLQSFTTLEELIAQLIFCPVDASWDEAHRTQVERLIQQLQVGGLVFVGGPWEGSRQRFLVNHYQQISKTPLLIVQDLIGPHPPFTLSWDSSDSYRELGQQLGGWCGRLGIHALLVAPPSGEQPRVMEFYRGLKAAAVSLGLEEIKGRRLSFQMPYAAPEIKSFLTPATAGSSRKQQLSLSQVVDAAPEQALQALLSGSDLLLCKGDIAILIDSIANAVRNGLLSEEILRERVHKLLLLKEWSVRLPSRAF